MPSEDTKVQEKDISGDISKQDRNPTDVKQKESMINKNETEDPKEEQELHNGSKRVKKNGLEQTVSTKKRNKEAVEGENVDGRHNGSFQEESSVESAMDEKPEMRNSTEEANSKVQTLNDRDQSNDIERGLASDTRESQSDKVVIEEEYCGGDDSDSECAEKDEESSTTQEQGPEDSNGQSLYKRTWEPMFCYWPGKEIHYFMGHKITIEESFDSYGAVIWPAAVALCKYLETPAGQEKINLLDKTVLELGAGTGLLSIVATLLGAKLTASDLPEILGNLRYNLNRNTRMLRRHEPQVIELSWGNKLEETFPHGTFHYDYVLAADVVYHHNFLAELQATMHHFCQPGTTLIWANKVRYQTDVEFAENFQKMFNATLLEELDEIKIYSATHKSSEENPFVRGR